MQEEIKKNADITANSEQLNKLKEMFPSCVDGDGRFRPDKLEDILRAEGADITREGYKLDWLGKSYARLLANLKTETLLAPNTEHNAKPENVNSKNLLIQGDNLDVLKHLVNAYSEKVKMIYIDPPYNTGSDGFVYADDRKFTSEQLAHLAGIDEDEAKRILNFTQSKSNSHSAWLTFMYPRLYIARELLRDDGVIFISIDDNEQAQLKMLCDEIFGEENFVSNIIWEKGRKNDAKLVSNGHEYLMCIVKNKGYLTAKEVLWREEKNGAREIQEKYTDLKASFGEDLGGIEAGLRAFYTSLPKGHPSKKHRRYSNVDELGVWRDDNMSWPGGGGPTYDVIHPLTGKVCVVPEGGWRYSTVEKMKAMIESGKVMFRGDHTEPPIRKTYLLNNSKTISVDAEEVGIGSQVNGSYFYRSSLQASNLLKIILGKKIFENPKDHEVIARWLSYAGGKNHDDLIVDFFAGSGTTAHAVLALNAKDGGKRRCISIQIDEHTDEKSEARKAGYNTILEITRERIIRSAKKIQDENPDAKCDFGFKEFKIIPANAGPFEHYLDDADTMEDYAPFDGIALDDNALDALLTTWKVYDGLPLHQDLIAVDLGGYTAYQGDDKLYFIHRGLELSHVVEMLRRLDEDDSFAPRKLVAFHYMFSDKMLREFSEAVNAPNRKHLELQFIQRF